MIEALTPYKKGVYHNISMKLNIQLILILLLAGCSKLPNYDNMKSMSVEEANVDLYKMRDSIS